MQIWRSLAHPQIMLLNCRTCSLWLKWSGITKVSGSVLVWQRIVWSPGNVLNWCETVVFETILYMLSLLINFSHCLNQVSMGGWGWGRGYGQSCSIWIFSIFYANSSTPGTGNLFKSDKISLSVFNKNAVWGKICGQNPHSGDKGSVQMPHLWPYPLSLSV